jgi:transposase
MTTSAKQKVVGIDVSKDSLAICHLVEEKLQHLETENNQAGFKQLVKQCGTESLYVMEAEPQMHGLRSAGSVFITYSWLITCMSRERR